MAKKTASKEETALIKQETALMESFDKSLISTKDLFIQITGATPEALDKIKNTYEKVTIKDIEDIAGYKFVDQGAKDLKKLRTTLSKKRKDLTAPAIKFRDEMKAEEDNIIDFLKPIEDSLLAKKQDFEDKKKAAQNKLFKERCEQLANHGYQLNGELYVCSAINIEAGKIADLTEDEFDFYLQRGQEELDRLAAEKKRKEKQDKKLQEEREAIAKERAEIAKEREELAAQRTALEETYKEVEKKEPIKKKEPEVKSESAHIPKIEQKKTEVKSKPMATKSKPQSKPEPSQIEVGFNEMRKRTLEYLSDPETSKKLKDFIPWIKKQEI